MKLGDYMDKLMPEEVELSREEKERILANAAIPGGRKRKPLRFVLVAACMAVILGAAVYAAAMIDWNTEYREQFNVKSDSVQGFVEYPDVEVTEEAMLQPVSCVTGIRLITVRFAYGPISMEDVEKLRFVDGQTEIIDVHVSELEEFSTNAGVAEYDADTKIALLNTSIYYEGEVPETLTLNVSIQNMASGAVIKELGTLVIEPQQPEIKTAKLDLPVEMADGRMGYVVALKIDSGSYCWVQDIPGLTDFDGDIDTAIRDSELGRAVTEWENHAQKLYYNDAVLNFADGSQSYPLGGGLGPMWDGTYWCQWGGGGVYDIENLVSVTINGVEYPFE